jgi:hypothetical protein
MNDAGLRFWLDHVTAEGGLWEPDGDCLVVVLPAELAAQYRLAEDLTVTDDPDIAREDGATFLGAGHPVLTEAAESVLRHGDVGYLALESPPQAPPSTEDLQDWARAQLPIGHGRIDVTGKPWAATHWLLRIGALVTYTVSTDNQFQEQTEAWIDVPVRRRLPADVVDRLEQMPAAAAPADALDDADLAAALSEAHRQIDGDTERRRVELARQLGDAHDRERQRAMTYYSDVMQGIERRLANAPEDRRALLQSRHTATQQEQDRRLQEIAEKYRGVHEIRPYRLHAVGVPVLRVPVDVRRGDRRYGMELDWMIPAGLFSVPRCPACASPAPLVAGKQVLGCLICLHPKTPPAPPPAVPNPRNQPVAQPKCPHPPQPAALRSPAPRPSPPRQPAPVPPPIRNRTPAPALGEKLASKLWHAMAAGDARDLRKLLAPDTPAATLHRLFGVAGLRHASGIPAEARLESFTTSDAGVGDDRGLTNGTVNTTAGRFPYTLHWSVQNRAAFAAEVLTYPLYPDARINNSYWWTAARRTHAQYEPTATGLDPVTQALVRAGGPWHGLAVVARAVTAWWRLMNEHDLQPTPEPAALAAAVHRLVAARAGDRGLFKDATDAYRADETSVRRADARIRKLLALGPDRFW